MRYIKVLLLACLIFLALVFFFQNQNILATKMELKLDLFFIPPMTSISLPFYFLVICAFFVGVLLALSLLVWDRLQLSARLLKSKWKVQSLSSKLAKAERLLNRTPKPSWFTRLRNFFSAEEAKPVLPSDDGQKSVDTVAKTVPQAQKEAVKVEAPKEAVAPSEAAASVKAEQPA
ncbi:MAG: DUF1049 domain-containing protein [Desulfovibrio sp.]|nr:DUF1049 domain-containing protein [Desulfovibrio sp.]